MGLTVRVLMVAAMLPGAAAAQAVDTNLSYRGGVVYDDDLVPGRPVDETYLRAPGSGLVPSSRRRTRRAPMGPANSPDLIGPDGEAVDARRRAELIGRFTGR